MKREFICSIVAYVKVDIVLFTMSVSVMAGQLPNTYFFIVTRIHAVAEELTHGIFLPVALGIYYIQDKARMSCLHFHG